MANPTRIAIVDDDDSVRKSLQGLIRSAGLAADVFPSAEEFLQSGHLRNAHALILDVRMPRMNGFEVQHHLAKSECDIPVIFITAHGDEKMRAEALKDGAVDFLLKPFSEDALLTAIYTALNSKP